MSALPTDPGQLARPAGSEALDVFSWPRRTRDGKVVQTTVRFRLLTTIDKHAARLNAEHRVKKLCEDRNIDQKMVEEMRADQRTIESLALACRKPDDSDQPWLTSMEIEAMPEIEVALLAKAYTEFEESFGPVDHELTLAKLDYWIEQAAKGETDFLVLLASHTRKACFTLMAKELLRSRAAKSSSTSPGSGDSSDSEAKAVTLATHADLDALEGRLAAEMTGRLDEITRQVGAWTLSGRGPQSGAVEVHESDPDDGGPVVDHG